MKFLMKGYMLPDATQKAEIGGSLEVKFVLGSTQLLTGNLRGPGEQGKVPNPLGPSDCVPLDCRKLMAAESLRKGVWQESMWMSGHRSRQKDLTVSTRDVKIKRTDLQLYGPRSVFVFLCVVALRLRKSGPGRRQSQTGCGNQFLEPPSGPILCQIVTGKAKPLPIGLLSGFVFALSWSLGGV